MTRRTGFLCGAICAMILSLLANLSIGPTIIPWQDMPGMLLHFDEDDYQHFILLYQRLPRALISVYVGALMACGGVILQGLTRNPLASPATLGINAGATMFVIAGAYSFDFGIKTQGAAALVGGVAGFLGCVLIARLAGRERDPRGMMLILSGALSSMLFLGIANAFLLSDPVRRLEFLGWVTGNINHVYADRLYHFWWIGVLALIVFTLLARPLTLITLGAEKAASSGVNVPLVTALALTAVMFGASSSVAICGPIGFVGLVVPHIVRPFVGTGFTVSLPACAATGATVCLLSDLLARQAFAPYVLHTGLIMNLIGGVMFALTVKRFYLSAGSGRET